MKAKYKRNDMKENWALLLMRIVTENKDIKSTNILQTIN